MRRTLDLSLLLGLGLFVALLVVNAALNYRNTEQLDEDLSWVSHTNEVLDLFEMFRQVDRNLGRSQGGLGIGLALVRSMVELHGGTVEAHSDGPGKGSEFVVRLPLARQRPDRHGSNGEVASGTHVASAASQLRILMKTNGSPTRQASMLI